MQCCQGGKLCEGQEEDLPEDIWRLQVSSGLCCGIHSNLPSTDQLCHHHGHCIHHQVRQAQEHCGEILGQELDEA